MSDEATQTVNIKGISSKEWEKARGIATRNGESMGEYVSRALAQLAEREAGERFFPPERFSPVVPPDLPSTIPALPDNPGIALPEVAAVLVALKEAGLPIQKRIGRQINALLDAKLRAAMPRQMPPMIEQGPVDDSVA